MRRATIVGVVVATVVLLGVGGAVAVSLADRGETIADESPQPIPSDSTPSPAVESPSDDDATIEPAEPGAYLDYSEEALAAASGTRVLFFHASWCPQCRALEADILASGVPAGVSIFKVDYDDNQPLRQRYGVTLQTTVVLLDGDGAAVSDFVAYDDPTLSATLSGLGLSG